VERSHRAFLIPVQNPSKKTQASSDIFYTISIPEMQMHNIEATSTDKAAQNEKLREAVCPDCGSELRYSEASFYCPICGFSQENVLIDL